MMLFATVKKSKDLLSGTLFIDIRFPTVLKDGFSVFENAYFDVSSKYQHFTFSVVTSVLDKIS